MTVSAFWAAVGAQLRRPEGTAGSFAGHTMRLANARINSAAVRALDPRSGERIVEIGCGPGEALHGILARDVASVTGIDHSAVMIRQAARRNGRALAAGRLRLVHGDFLRLPVESASVDAVLAVNVAYFMEDAAALTEIRRALTPGGRLVLYATSARAMRKWPFAAPHSHRLLDEGAFRDLISSAGFAENCTTLRLIDAGFGIEGLLAVARNGQPPAVNRDMTLRRA